LKGPFRGGILGELGGLLRVYMGRPSTSAPGCLAEGRALRWRSGRVMRASCTDGAWLIYSYRRAVRANIRPGRPS
jgi:hypothetical protein